MRIVEQEIERVLPVPPGTAPNYTKNNPLWRVVEAVEATQLACGLERYVADSLQYLYPIETLALYGPSGDQWQDKDPRVQDNLATA